MAKNRKAAEEHILAKLEEILPGNPDVERYRAAFAKWTNAEFDQFMQDLASGEKFLTLTAPNFGKNQLNLKRNITLAKKWGVKLFQRIWMPAEGKSPSYLTPIEYMVIPQPFRLASQRVAKKMSVPQTQRVMNVLTGQPTGDSKGSSLSYPEIRLCTAMGLEKTSIELLKYRGGDVRGNAALNSSLMRTGRASQDVLAHFASGVESTATVKAFLTSAHLKSTL